MSNAKVNSMSKQQQQPLTSVAGATASHHQHLGDDYLYQFLQTIQLESFYGPLRERLQITRMKHFEYVKTKDLEKIGMSKPAIRRLLDAVKKAGVNQLPVRPAPPPPPPPPTPSTPSQSTSSSQFNSKVTSPKSILPFSLKQTNLKFTDGSKTTSKSNESRDQSAVSLIINPSDLQIIKTKTGDEILGTGHFGVVKKALWTTHTGSKIYVAVKCLHDNLSQQGLIDTINEVTCMSNLDHPNLIKLYGVVLNTTDSKINVTMVTELAPYGSMLLYLRQHNYEKKFLGLNQIYSYIYQIAYGMEYLESKKVLHRDLAARNILLSTLDHVKICDFGMARNVHESGSYSMKETHKIPCAWYAPESIRDKIFTVKSDVWSFGVTVWEIFTLCEQPWAGLSAGEILKQLQVDNKRLPKPFVCSKVFYKLLLSCWEANPAHRPSFQQLKVLIKTTKIVEMKAKQNFNQENKLQVNRNDIILIIDGKASLYWWKGQNKRTLDVGRFPRMILDPERKLNSEDISMPLRNSFIHTGHMGIRGENDRTWGNPAKIDEIFLRNPLNPPDLIDNVDECDEDTVTVDNNQSDKNTSEQSQDEFIQDLIDFSSDEVKITYPDSLLVEPRPSASVSVSPSSLGSSNSECLYQNDHYMSEKLSNQTANNINSTNSAIYYNEPTSNGYIHRADASNYLSNTTALQPTSTLGASLKFKPTNPFCNDLSSQEKKPEYHHNHHHHHQQQHNHHHHHQNHHHHQQQHHHHQNQQHHHHQNQQYHHQQQPYTSNVNSTLYTTNYARYSSQSTSAPSNHNHHVNNQHNINSKNGNSLTVDDYLNKVMNDVLNEFKNIKS